MNPVARIRRSAGLTQQELADLSGVAQPNIAAYENGTRTPSPAMLERLAAAAKPRPSSVLAQHRLDISRLAELHHATDVKVFGSVARGEDRPGSDLDLLVTFSPGATLYDQIELEQEIEALLGISVDVVSTGGLTGVHAGILGESRPL